MSFASRFMLGVKKFTAKAMCVGLAGILFSQSAGAAVALAIDADEYSGTAAAADRQSRYVYLTPAELAEMLGWQADDSAEDYSKVEFRIYSATVYTNASMTEKSDNVFVAVSGYMPGGCSVVAYPTEVPYIGADVVSAYRISVTDHNGDEVEPQEGEQFVACINDPAIEEYFDKQSGSAQVVKVNGSENVENIPTGFDGSIINYNIQGSGTYAVLYTAMVNNATNSYNNSQTTTFRVKWNWGEGESAQNVILHVCADGKEITNLSSGDFAGINTVYDGLGQPDGEGGYYHDFTLPLYCTVNPTTEEDGPTYHYYDYTVKVQVNDDFGYTLNPTETIRSDTGAYFVEMANSNSNNGGYDRRRQLNYFYNGQRVIFMSNMSGSVGRLLGEEEFDNYNEDEDYRITPTKEGYSYTSIVQTGGVTINGITYGSYIDTATLESTVNSKDSSRNPIWQFSGLTMIQENPENYASTGGYLSEDNGRGYYYGTFKTGIQNVNTKDLLCYITQERTLVKQDYVRDYTNNTSGDIVYYKKIDDSTAFESKDTKETITYTNESGSTKTVEFYSADEIQQSGGSSPNYDGYKQKYFSTAGRIREDRINVNEFTDSNIRFRLGLTGIFVETDNKGLASFNYCNNTGSKDVDNIRTFVEMKPISYEMSIDFSRRIDMTNIPLAEQQIRIEHDKYIDYLGDAVYSGSDNPDTGVDNADSSYDTSELYRLYLDVAGREKPMDIMIICDVTTSMNDIYGSYNLQAETRYDTTNRLITDPNGLIQKIYNSNNKNKISLVTFAGATRSGNEYGRHLMGYNPNTSFDESADSKDYVSEVMMTWWDYSDYLSHVVNGTDKYENPYNHELFKFENNENKITNRFNTNGGTIYAAGFKRAADLMHMQEVANDGNDKMVIFITDGFPNGILGRYDDQKKAYVYDDTYVDIYNYAYNREPGQSTSGVNGSFITDKKQRNFSDNYEELLEYTNSYVKVFTPEKTTKSGTKTYYDNGNLIYHSDEQYVAGKYLILGELPAGKHTISYYAKADSIENLAGFIRDDTSSSYSGDFSDGVRMKLGRPEGQSDAQEELFISHVGSPVDGWYLVEATLTLASENKVRIGFYDLTSAATSPTFDEDNDIYIAGIKVDGKELLEKDIEDNTYSMDLYTVKSRKSEGKLHGRILLNNVEAGKHLSFDYKPLVAGDGSVSNTKIYVNFNHSAYEIAKFADGTNVRVYTTQSNNIVPLGDGWYHVECDLYYPSNYTTCYIEIEYSNSDIIPADVCGYLRNVMYDGMPFTGTVEEGSGSNNLIAEPKSTSAPSIYDKYYFYDSYSVKSFYTRGGSEEYDLEYHKEKIADDYAALTFTNPGTPMTYRKETRNLYYDQYGLPYPYEDGSYDTNPYKSNTRDGISTKQVVEAEMQAWDDFVDTLADYGIPENSYKVYSIGIIDQADEDGLRVLNYISSDSKYLVLDEDFSSGVKMTDTTHPTQHGAWASEINKDAVQFQADLSVATGEGVNGTNGLRVDFSDDFQLQQETKKIFLSYSGAEKGVDKLYFDIYIPRDDITEYRLSVGENKVSNNCSLYCWELDSSGNRGSEITSSVWDDDKDMLKFSSSHRGWFHVESSRFDSGSFNVDGFVSILMGCDDRDDSSDSTVGFTEANQSIEHYFVLDNVMIGHSDYGNVLTQHFDGVTAPIISDRLQGPISGGSNGTWSCSYTDAYQKGLDDPTQSGAANPYKVSFSTVDKDGNGNNWLKVAASPGRSSFVFTMGFQHANSDDHIEFDLFVPSSSNVYRINSIKVNGKALPVTITDTSSGGSEYISSWSTPYGSDTSGLISQARGHVLHVVSDHFGETDGYIQFDVQTHSSSNPEKGVIYIDNVQILSDTLEGSYHSRSEYEDSRTFLASNNDELERKLKAILDGETASGFVIEDTLSKFVELYTACPDLKVVFRETLGDNLYRDTTVWQTEPGDPYTPAASGAANIGGPVGGNTDVVSVTYEKLTNDPNDSTGKFVLTMDPAFKSDGTIRIILEYNVKVTETAHTYYNNSYDSSNQTWKGNPLYKFDANSDSPGGGAGTYPYLANTKTQVVGDQTVTTQMVGDDDTDRWYHQFWRTSTDPEYSGNQYVTEWAATMDGSGQPTAKNPTSSNQPGFYSNTDATVKFNFEGKSYMDDYRKPVVQVKMSKGFAMRKLQSWDKENLPASFVRIQGAEFVLYEAKFSDDLIAEITNNHITVTPAYIQSLIEDPATRSKIVKVSADPDNSVNRKLTTDTNGILMFQEAAVANLSNLNEAALHNEIYILEESRAPDGYCISTDVWYIWFEDSGYAQCVSRNNLLTQGEVDYVKIDGSNSQATTVSHAGTVSADDTAKYKGEYVPVGSNPNAWTRLIPNTMVYNLPSSGSIGTYIFTLGGVALMTAAYLVNVKFRREQEAFDPE